MLYIMLYLQFLQSLSLLHRHRRTSLLVFYWCQVDRHSCLLVAMNSSST